MLILRSFINLFVVPVVAIVVCYRKKLDLVVPNFKLLLEYCILVSINIPVTRLLTFIIRTASGMQIEADSSYYTICAIPAAALLGLIWNVFLNNKCKK